MIAHLRAFLRPNCRRPFGTALVSVYILVLCIIAAECW